MTDLELLKKYEPVLRFAKSERFFPMPVEPYLERCSLFASGSQGILELFTNFNEPLITRIGKLNSEEFYLRFINKPLNDSDVWVWWGILSIIGITGAWLLTGVTVVDVLIALSLAAALVIFMLASPVRLRIIPAVLATLLFFVLEITPVWFFLHPSKYVGFATEYLILLPVYLIVLSYLALRTTKFILDHIIPEGPGMVMEMLSQATEKIARESYYEYARILEEFPQPVYYGRILHETDKASNHWVVLQYHYFYAFNDWRLAANGMNHHEADWEMVAVYLKNDAPYAVLFSQHGAGNIEKWGKVHLVIDQNGDKTSHPIVYVALGSHANYSRPEVIRSPSMYKPGKLQRFLFWIDGLIQYLFLLLNPHQKARQIALQEAATSGSHLLAEDAFNDLRDETDHYVVSLPMEIATGDGFRIGFQGDLSREGRMKSSSYLKRVMSNRKTTHPRIKEWECILLNSEPDWVKYKGLWGVKSFLRDESGPPGLKWDRPRKNEVGVRERKRWNRPLDWLAELEHIRRKN